jgi:hypothetical protein
MSFDLESEQIDDPVGFFGAHGHLNDAVVENLVIDASGQILQIAIDDLYANLDGRPDYPGTRPCFFTFYNISKLRCDVDISDGLRIAELRVIEGDDPQTPFTLEIDFNIGGTGKNRHLVAKFAALELDDADEGEDDED